MPVINMDREGEHAGEAWKSLNRTPSLPSLSILGVLISPPKHPGSVNPRSSARMIKVLGLSTFSDVVVVKNVF